METQTTAARLRTRLSGPGVVRVSGAHDDAARAGVAMVIYANQALRAAVRSMQDALGQVLDSGSSSPIEPRIAPMTDIFRLQRVEQWLALES
jgi:2-methylisocitrate lyase-like PEP mutase family enzyme